MPATVSPPILRHAREQRAKTLEQEWYDDQFPELHGPVPKKWDECLMRDFNALVLFAVHVRPTSTVSVLACRRYALGVGRSAG